MNPTTVRLLVIDDDPVQARAIEAILSVYTEPRFAVADALSLAAGTARLREGEFDAVLLDLTLPDSAGLETYLTMQRQFPNLPIVVLTGTDDEKNTMGCLGGLFMCRDYPPDQAMRLRLPCECPRPHGKPHR